MTRFMCVCVCICVWWQESTNGLVRELGNPEDKREDAGFRVTVSCGYFQIGKGRICSIEDGDVLADCETDSGVFHLAGNVGKGRRVLWQ